MNEGTPKLYANKPKRAQMKLAQPSPPPSSSSPAAAAATAAASYSMGTPTQNHPPPPPPQSPPPGKESFARRYKFLWPILLTVNLAVGAYLFMRTSEKDTERAEEEEEEDSKVALAPPASSSVPTTASMADKSPFTPPVVQPVIKKEPIPPSQQRELFKWMLEEKRKIKPKDTEERKRNEEEKAILKQFLRTCFKRGRRRGFHNLASM